MITLGFDPGGRRKNGVAIADFRGSNVAVQTDTCDSVDEAINWFRSNVGVAPHGIGIDSYLSWSTRCSGWRPMDIYLRNTYPQIFRSIFCSNSANGSMAVQGMALAIRAKQIWPKIQLNETHPKALYFALSDKRYKYGSKMMKWLQKQFTPPIHHRVANDHEWDALISAWATLQGLSQQWKTDLMSDAKNLLRPAGKTTYYWP